MLSDTFSLDDLFAMNMPVSAFPPYPRYEDRTRWADVSPETARIWITAAEEQLTFPWPAITAEMILTLKTTGALKPHWDRFRERRSALGMLAVAECIEGRGRFVNQIINGIVAICEETAWISPLATRPYGYELPEVTDREVDLCSSETAALLAWIDYLLGERLAQVTKRLRGKLRAAIRAQVIQPYLDRDDYWWMGFTKDRINNWNPWCNMNVITCLLLTEDDPTVRARGLHKVLRSLDRYIETYMPDGCCDEGPMYWGAAGAGLFICLELLYAASGGQIDGFAHEKIRLIGEYIEKVHIDGEWFVNYADGDAHVQLDSATYRFGKALQNEGMMGLGARAKPVRPAVYDWFHTHLHLAELFFEKERAACACQPAYLKDAWLWHTGVMTAREVQGSAQGLFVSAKAGNNLESHNHNDIGNFIIYADGKPVLIDIGTEEYSVKTFSPERYDIWYTQSQYHNCPGVRGVLQHVGAEFRADDVRYEQRGETSTLSMELKHAYPKEAGITSWRRSVSLDREHSEVVVADCFELDEPTDDVVRFLMTPCKPSLAPGAVSLPYEDGNVVIHFDTEETSITIEEIPITESRLLWNWGNMLYRIVLRESKAVSSGERMLRIRKVGV